MVEATIEDLVITIRFSRETIWGYPHIVGERVLSTTKIVTRAKPFLKANMKSFGITEIEMLTPHKKNLLIVGFLIMIFKKSESQFMRKYWIFLVAILFLFPACQKKNKDLFTIGLFQVDDAPTLNSVRKGFLSALEEAELLDGVNIRMVIRNGMGSIIEVQRIAQEFVSSHVDLIVSLSTPCLQAALHASSEIPIVFSSVANPFLAGAGRSVDDHLQNVTGISSRGPIKESLAFIKQILPGTKRVGTLWTPSELNSKYYLDLAREGAKEMGFEIIAVAVNNKSEVLLAAQVLMNKKIDVIYQISDNTINASFEAISRVADENAVPLFGGALFSTNLGACAAMGWDFFEMGHRAGQVAIQVKNGESPAGIPIQYMKEVKLHLNLNAAAKQGVEFSEDILTQADEILRIEGKSRKDSATS
jgi:putative ABC transport system substrate-binding protein